MKKEKNSKINEYVGIKALKKDFIDFFKSFKKWSKTYISTNILFMTFVLTSLINAYLIRFFTVKNYFNLKPIIADLAVILIIGAFGYLFKPKHQFKYYIT